MKTTSIDDAAPSSDEPGTTPQQAIREMLTDWDALTEAQRTEALAASAASAEACERLLVDVDAITTAALRDIHARLAEHRAARGEASAS